MDTRSNRIYSALSPSLVVPNHFFCNESSTLVAIYDEPLGKETDGMALIFPGDVPGSSPQRVVPRRVDTRTLVFQTPVYTSANRGAVEVLPVLGLSTGEVELSTFKIGLKHPIRNVMELCIHHSTNEAVLPVLISLMVHCDDDGKVGRKNFQDPHIDRIMATLVGSRTPGSSTSIRDIVLPSRKWKRMSLADFGREFGLQQMEKQAYMLKTERLRWAKNKPKALEKSRGNRRVPVYENTKGSLPLPRKMSVQEEQDGEDVEVPAEVRRLMKNAELYCKVVEDYRSSEPGHLTLKAGQTVYIINQVVDGMWYGVCDGKCGYFPQSHIHYLRTIKRSGKERDFARNDSLDSLAGQPITSDSLKRLPKHTYANLPCTRSEVVSESSDSGSPFLHVAERMHKMNAFMLPHPNLGHSGLSHSANDLDRIPPEHLEPIDLPRKMKPHANYLNQPAGSRSPLATHKVRMGPIKQGGVCEDSSESACYSSSEPEEPTTPQLPHVHRAVRHNVNQGSPQVMLLPVPGSPQSRRDRPIPQPRTRATDTSDHTQHSSTQPPPTQPKPGRQKKTPLLPPTQTKPQQQPDQGQTQVSEELVGGHIYTVPSGLVPPRDVLRSTPPHSNVPKLPISQSKSAPVDGTRGNTEPFMPHPHKHGEHLTVRDQGGGHPRHRGHAMGVPVFPAVVFPKSKGHSEVDSGWSSTGPGTDTETRNVDEDYDDVVFQYNAQ